MLPRLLLVSSNLAAPAFGATVKRFTQDAARGAIVTTSETKLKERTHHALLASAALASGTMSLEFFDLDQDPSEELEQFDAIFLTGGNPYYLLRRIRETDADAVLEKRYEAGVPLMAVGAATVLLGPSLRHLRIFDPNVPDLGWKSTAALNLIPFTVLPHANRWRSRFSDYEARLASACTVSGCQIVELNDGEGVSVEGRKISCVGGGWVQDAWESESLDRVAS